ncbi:MAG: hypothetical protein Q9195_000306 [Heterodermia aff. obscurata]
MNGNAHPSIDQGLRGLKLERSVTPAQFRLTRPIGNIHEDHATVRKITCLGSGFVGGPTSAVTAYKSNVEVTVVDINEQRIKAWKSEQLPIYEPGLQEIVYAARDGVTTAFDDDTAESLLECNGYLHPGIPSAKLSARGKLSFSTDIEKAIEEADLIFVCVNTPTKSTGVGKGAAADLGFVESATRTIARVAKTDKIVVEKSTVPCKTAESIRAILSENARPGVRFNVLSNPEFLAEGTAIRDLLHPDRVIIGSMPTAEGYSAAASLVEVYSQWVPKERIITMNLWSSELCKLAANAMLAQRISSVNALSAICEVTGADVDEVSYACGLDSRIGPQMLKAGPGFGGSCFQKDIFNIVYLSESLNLNEVADFWRVIISMNEHQKDRFTRRIISCLFNNLTNKRIAVLGFAFKKDTSDTRESPAITLVSNFVAEQARVAIYDPKVIEQQIWRELVDYGGSLEKLKLQVEVTQTAYAACEGADAVVVVTEWDEFSNKAKPDEQVVLSEIDPNQSISPKRFDKPREAHLPSPGSIDYENKTGGVTTVREFQVVLKSHAPEVGRLDWARIAQGMRKPRFVFDGRNMLDHQKLVDLGFRVEAIGKASRKPKDSGN